MNTPDNCYLDKGHDAHDLLAPGESCKACGFALDSEVEVQGQTRRLYFYPKCYCGGRVGVGLHFEGEGGWVIPISEMRRMVAAFDAVTASDPLFKDAKP